MTIAVAMALLGLTWGDVALMTANLLEAIERSNADLIERNEWSRR